MKTLQATNNHQSGKHYLGLSITSASVVIHLLLRDLLTAYGLKDATSLAMGVLISLAIFVIGLQKMMTASAQIKPTQTRSWAEAIFILMASFWSTSFLLVDVLSLPGTNLKSYFPNVDFGKGYLVLIFLIIVPSIAASIGVYYSAMKFRSFEAKRLSQSHA